MKKTISLLLILILTLLNMNIVMAENHDDNAPYSLSYLQDINGSRYVRYSRMDDQDMEDGKMLQRSMEMYDVLDLYLKDSNWSSIIKPFRNAFLKAGLTENTNMLENGDVQYIYSKDVNPTQSEVFIILGQKESKDIINESGVVYIVHALLQFDYENADNNEITEDEKVVAPTSTLLVQSVNGNISISLNGENIKFDVQPQIINDRTMVPLRAIFEALGATVDWNGDTQTVTSTKDGTTISLAINNPTMYVNGAVVTLDSPACLVEGRTLVPVRAISEAFNIKVEWEEIAPVVYDDLSANINQINDMISKGMYLEAIRDCEQTIAWHNCSPEDENTLNSLKSSAEAKYNSYLKAEEEKKALANPISAPYDTIDEMRQATYYMIGKCYNRGNFYVGKDSANGIFLHWAAKNVTNKTIKYLTYTVEFYNAVNDLTQDEITNKTSKIIRLTGPIEPQGTFYIKDIIGYSVDCQSVKITNMKVEYMDGTSSDVYYGYKTEWYRPGVAF